MRLFSRWRKVLLAAALIIPTSVGATLAFESPPAVAGVNAWTLGCKDMWWYQTSAMVDWQVYTSHWAVLNGSTVTVTGAIRRTWRAYGNECGYFGVPTSQESYGSHLGPFGYRMGWYQHFSFGWPPTPNIGGIFWDQYDCNKSYWEEGNSLGLTRHVGGLCPYS